MTHLAQTPVDTDSSGAATPTLTPSAGSDRVWLLGVSHEQSNLTTWMNAFTVGGQTPTLFNRASHGSTTNNAYAEFYYLLESQVAALSANPAFSCGTPGNDYFGITVFELSGRDQTPANWTWNSNGSDTITAATLSLTGGTNYDVCAILSCTSGVSGGSFSAGVTEVTGTDRGFNGTNSRTLAGTATSSSNPLTVTGDISSSSGSTFQLLAAVGIPPAAADTTPPTLSSATIGTNGTTVTLAFSETVSIGAGGNGGFALTPSGGAASLTYSSGSGSSSLVYTSNRTINSGETATVAYTQPGNGVEDAAGNDLATFSGTSVTNNSTQTSGPTISSVDSTPEHLATEAFTGTGFPTSQSGSAAVKFVGAIETVTLTPTYDTATALSAAFDVGNNKLGVAATVTVTDSSGNVSSGYAVTPQPRAGGAVVNLSTLAAAALRLEATPDLQSGYQVEYYGGVGCTCGSDLIVFDDATVQYPDGAVGFYARAHNGTSWGAPAFITIASLLANRRGLVRDAVRPVVRPVAWDVFN